MWKTFNTEKHLDQFTKFNPKIHFIWWWFFLLQTIQVHISRRLFQIFHPTIRDTFLEKDLDFPNHRSPTNHHQLREAIAISQIYSLTWKIKRSLGESSFESNVVSSQKTCPICKNSGIVVELRASQENTFEIINTQIHKYGFP